MLHIICALKHEARPLVDHFQLVHDGSATAFTAYTNRDAGLSLTVTKPGQGNAAAAVGFVHNTFHSSGTDKWLNIGIAGHASLALGTPVLVNKIINQPSGQEWVTGTGIETDLLRKELITVDTPVSEYQPDYLYDLEAAGFMEAAMRFCIPEQIHCLKIVSDNRDNSHKNISGSLTRGLMLDNIPVIDKLVAALK